MTLTAILDTVYPATKEILTNADAYKEWEAKRKKLRRDIEELIMQHKAGQIVNFNGLNISIDIEEALKIKFN